MTDGGYLENYLQLVSLSDDGHFQCSGSSLLQGSDQLDDSPERKGMLKIMKYKVESFIPGHGVISLHQLGLIDINLSSSGDSKHILR